MQCRPASQAVQRTRSRPNDGLRPKVPPAGAGADLKTKGDGACLYSVTSWERFGYMFHNTSSYSSPRLARLSLFPRYRRALVRAASRANRAPVALQHENPATNSGDSDVRRSAELEGGTMDRASMIVFFLLPVALVIGFFVDISTPVVPEAGVDIVSLYPFSRPSRYLGE